MLSSHFLFANIGNIFLQFNSTNYRYDRVPIYIYLDVEVFVREGVFPSVFPKNSTSESYPGTTLSAKRNGTELVSSPRSSPRRSN